MIELYTTCPKCHGQCFIPQYSHIEAGICFKCSGFGESRVRITFRPDGVRIGADVIPVKPYLEMSRRDLIDLTAKLLKTPKDGRSIAVLGIILGTVDLRFHERGVRAFCQRSKVQKDRDALRDIIAEVFDRWGNYSAV